MLWRFKSPEHCALRRLFRPLHAADDVRPRWYVHKTSVMKFQCLLVALCRVTDNVSKCQKYHETKKRLAVITWNVLIRLLFVLQHVFILNVSKIHTPYNKARYTQRKIITTEFTCVKPESQNADATMWHFTRKSTVRHYNAPICPIQINELHFIV
jgi:hypothetical protein